MGVTIDLYRSRIGTFNSQYLRKKSGHSASTTSLTPLTSWSRRIALVVSFTFFLTLFAAAAQQATCQEARIYPLPSSPGPACCSSTCPWPSAADLVPATQHCSLWLPPWPPPWQMSTKLFSEMMTQYE